MTKNAKSEKNESSKNASKKAKNALDILRERGFIEQIVFEEKLTARLENESIRFYVGFDPTADSLHIGHYIPIMAIAHMQRAGHQPIVMVGGGTGMIGDPSNSSDMRQMMSKEEIDRNCSAFVRQMGRFLRFEGENAAIVVDNGDWLLKLNYVDFLRDVGIHFSVNKMLSADCFKSRMEKGLSFLEFNYMLMQAYDFFHLNQNFDCILQIGGNDQWSNILAGADLIRRKLGKEVYCMTLKLLATSEGTKMGKTQKGALWLDSEKTTVYDFYQYFRNIEDVKVRECMQLLTFMEMDEIEELTAFNDERMNDAKVRLAFEVTKLVHGDSAAREAAKQVHAAFSGKVDDMDVIEIALSRGDDVVELMVVCGVAKSKGEARRLIEGGGIHMDEKKVEGANAKISELVSGTEFVLHKGKKTHLRIRLTK